MRVLIVLVVAISLGKLLYEIDPLLGSLALFLMFFIAGPALYAAMFFRRSFFSKKVNLWAKDNCVGFPVLNNYNFTKGKLRWKVSDVQDVFLLSDGDKEYWVVCGTWFWGAYSSEIGIYTKGEEGLSMIFKG